MIRTAVIIAGGEGSRLKPLSNNKPKAMVEIDGEPMLRWIIRWLQSHGIQRLVLGVAFKKEKIISYMKANRNFGLSADISVHTLEGGTAQGFRLAISRFVQDEDFVAMNCDEITNMNLGKLIRTHEAKRPLVTMALAPFHCRFSVVQTRPDGFIKGFKYGHILEDAPVSIGIYAFRRRILEHLPETGSIEHAVFTPLSAQRKIAYHRLLPGEHWISVNDVKNVREVEENKALFRSRPSRKSNRAFHIL